MGSVSRGFTVLPLNTVTVKPQYLPRIFFRFLIVFFFNNGTEHYGLNVEIYKKDFSKVNMIEGYLEELSISVNGMNR